MEEKGSVSTSVTSGKFSQGDQQLGARCEKNAPGKRSKFMLAIRLLLLVKLGLFVTACIKYPENQTVQNCKEYVIVGVLIFVALKLFCVVLKFVWRRKSARNENVQNREVPWRILSIVSGGIVCVAWFYFPESKVVQTSKEYIVVTPLLLLGLRILSVVTRFVMRCFNCIRNERRGILWKLLFCLGLVAVGAAWIYLPENEIVQKSKLYTFGGILALVGLKMITVISKLVLRCLKYVCNRKRKVTLQVLIFVTSCLFAVPWIFYPENEAVQKSKKYILTGVFSIVGLKAFSILTKCLWRYSKSDHRRKVPWKLFMLTGCGLVGAAWIYFPENHIVNKSKEYVMVSSLAIVGFKATTVISKFIYRCLRSVRRERRKYIWRALFVVFCGLVVAAWMKLPEREAVENSKEYIIVSLLAIGVPQVLAMIMSFYRWVFKPTGYGKKGVFCKILLIKSTVLIGFASVYFPENKIVKKSQEYLIASLSAIIALAIFVKVLKLTWRYIKPVRKDKKDTVDSGVTKPSKIETPPHKKISTKSNVLSDKPMKTSTKTIERRSENISYSSKQGPGFDLYHTPKYIDKRRQEEYAMRRTYSGGFTEIWEDFRQNHENMASLNNFGQEKSRRVLLSTLRGPAGLYAYGLPLCIQRNYDRLVEKMGERFGYSAMQARIENGNNESGQRGVTMRKTI